MSLYNLINGVNPAAFFFLPMLGHHPDEYPRFRDCFVEQDPDRIVVFTRTGGGNREDYAEENHWITTLPGFVSDDDDDFDSTFAYWRFAVPERWSADFSRLINGRAAEVSSEYEAECIRVYPKLADKYKEIFATARAEEGK